MDNQDKLHEQFRQAAQKSEGKDFAAMEKVWARVEEKLDKKKDRKAIVLWQKLAIAASLLLFFTLGYQFLKSDPVPVPDNQVVTVPATEPDKTDTPKTDAVVVEPTSEERVLDPEHAAKVLVEKQAEQGVAVNEDVLKESDSVQQPSKVLVYKKRSRQAELNFVAEVGKKEAKEDFEDPTKSNNAVTINEAILSENNIQTNDTEIAVTEVVTNRVTGEKTISGVITDKQLPLPGVSVVVKSTSKGTQSDYDGNFSIKVKPGDQLLFSYIGYQSSIVTVGKSSTINVALQEDSQALQEVIVMGYTSKKRSKITTTVTEVNGLGFQKPATTLDRMVQRRAAGVEIVNINGNPGAEANATIRGVSSLHQNENPLYIIDGVVAPDLSVINPNHVSSMTVLKDAATTSLYGSRAANGVIVITTKKGNYKNSAKAKRALGKQIGKIQKIKTAALVKKPIEVTQEEYDSFIENPFESPKNKPLSTFSIDVDNASYTNVRRFINNGQTVPKDAVRVEEMVNFFKYDYPQPKGDHPFSINTEYSEAPWNPKHKILRIGLQGKIIPTDELQASNLVFLIDVSGSMDADNKLPLLKQSMKILVGELRKKDKVSIVVYAGAAGLVLPPTSGDEKQTIIDALEKLNAGGSTAGGAGIELAYKIAEENFIKNGNNRVILATDGDFNVGGSSNSDMQTLIEEKRKTGVFLTCLGYGMGNYKDSKMEILSDKGNGNYAYIDNIQEANRFLGKEFKGSMFAIAKDVKIQIEFNPKHVQSYRLIGYENRKLRDEDFANDQIDAGELGSGHTVTALYEIIPTGVESAFFQNTPELKYTKVEAAGNAYTDELATIKFRHKKPDGDSSIETVYVIENKSLPLQNASADFRFSTAVAWFGLKLRDSKLVPNKDTEAIKKLAKEGLQNDSDGYKAEFIRLVETIK